MFMQLSFKILCGQGVVCLPPDITHLTSIIIIIPYLKSCQAPYINLDRFFAALHPPPILQLNH